VGGFVVVNINQLLSRFEELAAGVEHEVQKHSNPKITVHHFSRYLPAVTTAGRWVFGHIQLPKGQKEVPRREIEALLRRLWLLQHAEEWFGD